MAIQRQKLRVSAHGVHGVPSFRPSAELSQDFRKVLHIQTFLIENSRVCKDYSKHEFAPFQREGLELRTPERSALIGRCRQMAAFLKVPNRWVLPLGGAGYVYGGGWLGVLSSSAPGSTKSVLNQDLFWPVATLDVGMDRLAPRYKYCGIQWAWNNPSLMISLQHSGLC